MLVPPLKPNLQVMILRDHPTELSQQLVALLGIQLVDRLRKAADGVDALPARDGVRAYHGVHGAKVLADVVRRSAGLVVQFGAPCVGGFDEPVADECGGQAFEEFLVRGAEAVVDLVAAGPDCGDSLVSRTYGSKVKVTEGSTDEYRRRSWAAASVSETYSPPGTSQTGCLSATVRHRTSSRS
jgi:hypothetical protein